jgi:hypothetical protein
MKGSPVRFEGFGGVSFLRFDEKSLGGGFELAPLPAFIERVHPQVEQGHPRTTSAMSSAQACNAARF